jgi:protein-S-isoprenylcysteine O-methyltransferase Ste14
LPLIEELTRSGRWLFRWRSYLPLTFIALALWSMASGAAAPAEPNVRAFWDFLCLAVSLAGLGVRVWTVGHTPKGTSGRGTSGQEAETLNTTGMYSTTRHPLYLGNFFMGLGVALFPRLWWLAVIYVLAFWLYYERIMLAEEDFLRERFGDAFERWATRTPAFVPDPRRYERASLPFSLRNVLRREYNGAFAVVVAMFLLDSAGVWRADRHLGAHARWTWMLAAASVLWAVAISVKRGTTWLDVAGR